MDYIRYVAPIENFAIEKEIVVKDLALNINKVIINSKGVAENTYVELYFYINGYKNEKDADSNVKLYVEKFLNALAIKYNASIGGYRSNGFYINGIGNASIVILEELKSPIKISESESSNIERCLKDNTYQNNLMELYRLALGNRDIVARYMFLYNIVLQIFNDSQTKVDEFIIGDIGITESDYKDGPRKIKNGNYIKETKFTRLRNEVGHVRENVNTNNIREEMKVNIMELDRLTKKAILENGMTPKNL